jgi:hypothetical protein
VNATIEGIGMFGIHDMASYGAGSARCTGSPMSQARETRAPAGAP